MILRNTNRRYGNITKFFHWTLALLIVIQFSLAYWTIFVLPKNSPQAGFYIGKLHKPIGVVVLGLAILAVLWKLSNLKPTFPVTMSNWEKITAQSVHVLLYLSLIIMPLSGFLSSAAAGYPTNFFGLYQFPMFIEENKQLADSFFSVHTFTSYLLIALVVVHFGAALKHHFINRDPVLKRMLPFS